METKFFDLLFIIRELVPVLGRASLFDGTKTRRNGKTLDGFVVETFSWGPSAATRRH